MSKPITIAQLKDPVVFLATGFGSGLAPKAPGTAGTLVAVVLCYFLQALPLAVYALLTLVVVLAGIGICRYTADKLAVHDHPAIVIDEFAGYFVTMLAAPDGWPWLIAGFVLFRIFDIVKPWPICWLDSNLKGGSGIMLDDVAAGVAGFACIQAYIHIIGT